MATLNILGHNVMTRCGSWTENTDDDYLPLWLDPKSDGFPAWVNLSKVEVERLALQLQAALVEWDEIRAGRFDSNPDSPNSA